MLKKIFLILMLSTTFCLNAFATEINEEIIEDEYIETTEEESEVLINDSNSELQSETIETIDLESLEAEINEYEIEDFVNSEENKFNSDENTLFGDLIINGSIYDGTKPVSKNIYLSIFNYVTQEMKYIKLNKDDNYSTKINIPHGQYIINAYIYDDMDLIIMENLSIIISENPCTINVNIKGVKEETFDKLVEEEIIDDPNKEEIVIEEEVEEIVEEKNTIGDIIKDILYNNFFTLCLMAGAVIALGIKRYRDNNNLE